MARLAPRVKLNPNGTVTVSGLSMHDFKAILTAAWLHQSDSEKTMVQNPENLIYARRIRWILDRLEAVTLEASRRSWDWYGKPPTKEERWKKVKESQWMNRFLTNLFKHPPKSRVNTD